MLPTKKKQTVLGVVIAPFLWLACGDSRGVTAPPAHSTGPSPALVASASSASSADTLPEGPATAPWLAAVRLGRFKEAYALTDALDESAKSQPNMRFLRAYLAAELGKPADVQKLLEGLDLPLFATDIARLRAEAAAVVGPHEQAAIYYEALGKPRDLVRAAKARLAGGDTKLAYKTAEKAIEQAQKLRRSSDERAARALRAEILVAQGKPEAALPDRKWVAIRFPETGDGKRALAAIEADKKASLSDKEKRELVDNLLGAGNGKETTALLERWGKAFSAAELAHKKAEALYKSRKYLAASEAFLAASKKASGRTAEQLYYAARSLSRAKKEDDAEARYREVIKRFGKGIFAERSRHQLGMLLSHQGKYSEAAKAFTELLSHGPAPSVRDDAEYALGLAHLSSGDAKKARLAFARRAQSAKKTDWGVLRQLEGVAALRAGDKDDAVKLFREVATTQPLTFAAQASRARLLSLGEALPVLIEPPGNQTSIALVPILPEKAAAWVALGLDSEAEAALSADEAAASARYPGRETESLCLLYGQLSRAKRRYRVGSQAVSFDEVMRAPEPKDRWMWECLYPSPYQERVSELEKTYALAPGLIHSLMRQESAFDPEVRSPVGAQGLMQLMPGTAEQAAKEANLADFDPEYVTQPETNLALGGFYIAKLHKTFKGATPLAVAGYNAGPNAVARWLEKAKDRDIDVFVARIPYEETRNYVVRVMGNLARYQWLAGGDAAVTALDLQLPASSDAKDDDY